MAISPTQALTNLFGNAWKYTGKTAEAYIEFGSCRKNGKKVFFIRDNGAGFSMKQADRLFMPFQRSHSESEFSGTGIGLPIVQRVINRHDGKIWAEGERPAREPFFILSWVHDGDARLPPKYVVKMPKREQGRPLS